MENVDIVIIGAGFSGMYAVYHLREKYSVVCLEAGAGVGGTWYWNRYPGARVDIESVEYSYGFSEELQQEWRWPERFSAQPELERYANHVADRFGLRDHIRLGARVSAMRFDECENRWYVKTADGNEVRCRFVIAATGTLSASNVPEWPGRDSFRGEVYHTTQWPREGIDFTGKRVGIVGTGSTAIQAIPIIAEQAEHLHVFQRTPAYSMPSGNGPMDPEVERDWKANHAEKRKKMLGTWGASLIDYTTDSIHDVTPEERQRVLEEAWNSRRAFQLIFCFRDILTDEKANKIVADFARSKIREIVKDPDVADKLCSQDYPIGGKRLCIDNGYYQTYNRSNTTLVDIKNSPIVAFTPEGIRTADASYDLDILIMATGFDALTGSLSRIEIEGKAGLTLAEKWSEGATTHLGTMVAGFPNFFMIHGPMTPAAQAQMITTGEWQVNWVSKIIENLDRDGFTRIETTEDAEVKWAAAVELAASFTLHSKTKSWFNGANIEGKKGGFIIYVGGFNEFSRLCEEAVQNNFEGFVRSASEEVKASA